MSRTMVGLLAAVGTAVAVLAGLVHGHLVLLAAADAGIASGLAAYLALPAKKNAFLQFKLKNQLPLTST
jgi:hypothetical protein